MCVFTVGSSRTGREAVKRDWLGGGRERRRRQGAALSMRLKSWYQPPTPTPPPRPSSPTSLLTVEVRGTSSSQTRILPLTFRVLSPFVFLLFLLRH